MEEDCPPEVLLLLALLTLLLLLPPLLFVAVDPLFVVGTAAVEVVVDPGVGGPWLGAELWESIELELSCEGEPRSGHAIPVEVVEARWALRPPRRLPLLLPPPPTLLTPPPLPLPVLAPPAAGDVTCAGLSGASTHDFRSW